MTVVRRWQPRASDAFVPQQDADADAAADALDSTPRRSGGGQPPPPRRGSPRVDQARKIVAERRRRSPPSRSGSRSDSRGRTGNSNTSNSNAMGGLNPFQCAADFLEPQQGRQEAAPIQSKAPGVRMVRGSFSPPRRRGRNPSPRRDPTDDQTRSAFEESNSMISEATPVHGNRGEDKYREYLENAVEVNGRNAGNDSRKAAAASIPNHALLDDSSTLADSTTAMSPNPNSAPQKEQTGGSNSGSNSGGGTSERYTRIMHQYLVRSQTNPLTKRAAASVLVEALDGSTTGSSNGNGNGNADGGGSGAGAGGGGKNGNGRDVKSSGGGIGQNQPRSNNDGSGRPLPPLDPTSAANPTNTRLRSLLHSAAKDHPSNTDKADRASSSDATTEDMTSSYPISSSDGASTISSLSSGSGRRAAYRSLVHFLPSLLPLPTPPPPQPSSRSSSSHRGAGAAGGSSTDADSWGQPQAQPQPQQQGPQRGGSLSDLDVSGISYQSSHASGGGGPSLRDLPTPARSGSSRARDAVDPDGPVLGRRSRVRGGGERGADSDGGDSETLGSLGTATQTEGEGAEGADADSAVAGFYPTRSPSASPKRPPPQRERVGSGGRGGGASGGGNVARDVLSKYGGGQREGGGIHGDGEDAPAPPVPLRKVHSYGGGQGGGGNPIDGEDAPAAKLAPAPPIPLRKVRSFPNPATQGPSARDRFRMKARSRSPAAARPAQSDPTPAVTTTSAPSVNNVPKARGGGGGIAARIAMFENQNATGPPPTTTTTPPKPPRAAIKRWTPPPKNDIPDPPRYPNDIPSPPKVPPVRSNADDESTGAASVASIPFDERFDRRMRAAVAPAPPVPLRKVRSLPNPAALIEESAVAGEDEDDLRERMVMGQRHVSPSTRSRSVSPRKPNWQRAGTVPRRSPPPNAGVDRGSETKSIFSRPVTGNRVRYVHSSLRFVCFPC